MDQQIRGRISALKARVDRCVVNDEFKGYCASPALKEIVTLIEDNLDDSSWTLSLVFDDYYFVAERYARMGRFSLAAKYDVRALEVGLKLYNLYGRKSSFYANVYSRALRDRNYYIDDDCKDIRNMLMNSDILDKEYSDRVYNQQMNCRRRFNHDPIEMSEEYLAVIDEVEEKIDKNRTVFGMGACHEIWALKSKYLSEKGIVWRSPAFLNPRVCFD